MQIYFNNQTLTNIAGVEVRKWVKGYSNLGPKDFYVEDTNLGTSELCASHGPAYAAEVSALILCHQLLSGNEMLIKDRGSYQWVGMDELYVFVKIQ